MSTYVMSDIHGCYNVFLSMLERISFSAMDYLILAGDYIDRGKQSYEMLKWIEQCPSNALLLRGNHEEEFAAYVDLMLLHHPDRNDVKAYQAMEKFVEEGKIRSVGLSNWYVKELEEFLPQVNITPALVQNEIHPYYQEMM